MPSSSPPDDPRDWSAVEMSPSARRYLEDEFLKAYQRLRQDVAETSLVVLIWGPGVVSGGPLYKKRLEIRGRLRDMGIAAVFSEELADGTDNLTLKMQEQLQAMAADFIVVIAASAGSIGEVHDFASQLKTLAPKMIIFVQEEAEGGYASRGVLKDTAIMYRNVESFTPADVEQCNLMGAIQGRVEALRAAKWLREHAS
jgi:hypothetical protein